MNSAEQHTANPFDRAESTLLRVQHLTKKYGRVTALNDVSLNLNAGSVTALLGPNGAGKSTMIKAIMGLIRYDGVITLQDVSNRTPQARRRIGYVPELPSFYPDLTVREHMEFLARAYRLNGYRGRMNALLERFGLEGQRKTFGDELSKGMQQKLSLCMGLLPQPQILLLDEPMIGLDPHAIKELKSVIEEMRADGCALLLSTHIIESVDMIWDRCVILQEGRIRADVSPADLKRRGRTLEMYFFDVTEGSAPAETACATEEAATEEIKTVPGESRDGAAAGEEE